MKRYNRMLGNRKIVRLMMEHSVAKSMFSPSRRFLIKMFGPVAIRFLGFPISSSYMEKFGKMIGFLELKKSDDVLDIGCGPGTHSFEIAKMVNSYTGIDIDTEDIVLSRKIGKIIKISNVDFIVGDIFKADIRKKFNKVVLMDVIERVEDDAGLIKKLNHVLSKDGVLVIGTPKLWEHVQRNVKGHVRDGYKYEQLASLVKRCGFEVVGSFVNNDYVLLKCIKKGVV